MRKKAGDVRQDHRSARGEGMRHANGEQVKNDEQQRALRHVEYQRSGLAEYLDEWQRKDRHHHWMLRNWPAVFGQRDLIRMLKPAARQLSRQIEPVVLQQGQRRVVVIRTIAAQIRAAVVAANHDRGVHDRRDRHREHQAPRPRAA